MSVFSTRNGYKANTIQLESAGDTLRRRVFTAFYKEEFAPDLIGWASSISIIEDVMGEMGITYDYPRNSLDKQNNSNRLHNYLVKAKEWYVIFDFIERYLAMIKKDKAKRMTIAFNHILEEEASGYRIVDRLVVPITSESELETIQQAMNIPYDAPRTHIAKALDLFANRKNPDYENSVKESISAVESMCCIITGFSGANATLGTALKKLKDNGVHIHAAMEKAFLSLYGYTSDENGIRHGGIDFQNVPSEDAKYMLVSCSAFVNYLLEKWNKQMN